jgi:hypothetical protein
MPKTKHATLIFSDGRILTVPVGQVDGWPAFIDHVDIRATGQVMRDATLAVREKTIRFSYHGCQYGIGAYVETE